MFETISKPRPRRPAAGIAVAVALHVGVLGVVVWITRVHKPAEIIVIEPRVQPPRQGAPALSGPATTTPRHRVKPKHKPDLMLQPVQPQPEAAPEVVDEPADEPEASEYPGPPGTVIGQIGIPDGVPDGVPDGTGSPGAIGHGPVRFDEGRMTPPKQLSGPDPAYTPQALEREVEGDMVVRCIVTLQGLVRDCRVLRSLPFMDAAVLHALEQRRYSPARIAGQPVEVEYLFHLHLKLP